MLKRTLATGIVAAGITLGDYRSAQRPGVFGPSRAHLGTIRIQFGRAVQSAASRPAAGFPPFWNRGGLHVAKVDTEPARPMLDKNLAAASLTLGVLLLTSCSPTQPEAATEGKAPTDAVPTDAEAGRAAVKLHMPIAVPANRSADVSDGFRGDAHPMLHGRTPVEVAARWTPIERGQLKLEAPEEVLTWYTNLRPAVPRAAYAPRDFSAFLPAGRAGVGQVWAIDPGRMKGFLRQFHPGPQMHLSATGRRAGPDGAFAVLRAVSPSHADIAFRVHAEFFVTPPVQGELRSVYAWLTPAYFRGRLVVNKETGTVEYFQLAVPTEKALNLFLTVNPSLLNIPKLGHDIIRIDRMELEGGDGRLADSHIWSDSIEPGEAARRLARVFYKFEEIDWVPAEQVAARARSRDRPIFAIVSWGSTDDQSC